MPVSTQQSRSDARRGSSKLTYEWYINSSRWERRKTAYYATHAKKCRACGSTEDIHLHHHTYKRLGYEHDDDLIPLCQPHHDAVHKLHRSIEFTGTLTAATRAVIGGPVHPRKKKRPGRRERTQRPGPVKRGVDPVNIAMNRVRDNRRKQSLPPVKLIPLDEVIKEFSVTKKQLQWQGFRRSVPVSTVEQWRSRRPDWMEMACR